MNRIAVALLIGALSFTPGMSFASDDAASLEAVVAEMAHTPQQHMALANHYRGQADEARREMKRHESMARSYGQGKLTDKVRMKSHCENIAKQQASLAKEYDDLAKLHDDAAKVK